MMDLLKVSNALSNETRLKTLRLVADEPGSSITIHRRYLEDYNDEKRRESIYRALNQLTEAGLLKKGYNTEDNKIEYSMVSERLLVDLSKSTIDYFSESN